MLLCIVFMVILNCFLNLCFSLSSFFPCAFLFIIAIYSDACKTSISLYILNTLLCFVLFCFPTGGALTAMLDFYKVLVLTKTSKMGFQELLGLLTAPVYSPTEATQPSSTPYAVHKQVTVQMGLNILSVHQ